MNKTNIHNGGQAFPRARFGDATSIDADEGSAGMTLRDYFAAKAMQAQLHVGMESDMFGNAALIEKVARDAYIAADFMLKARRIPTEHQPKVAARINLAHLILHNIRCAPKPVTIDPHADFLAEAEEALNDVLDELALAGDPTPV
jgi:hypothetical protein